jgi:DNA-binding transcriptional regulator YiaG
MDLVKNEALTEAERLARLQMLIDSGEAREIRGDLPSEAVARAARVAALSVRRWENGERKATSPEALRYLDVLDALDRVRKNP